MKQFREILLFYFCLIGSFSLYGLDDALSVRIQELVASNPCQLSVQEYTCLAEEIERLAPCNVLVFGLGNDSTLWDQINTQGKTIFLEHNSKWYEKILSKNPHLNCYFVQYHTKLSEWKIFLDKDPMELKMDLPLGVMEIPWDVIFVDAPEGNTTTKPGRMQSIYMASILGQKGLSHIFVHDCDRLVEQVYCSRFLNHANLVQSIEKLRHYKFEIQ